MSQLANVSVDLFVLLRLPWSDYTHVMDIPPQYGPGYSLPGSEPLAARIDGRDGSWRLPLPPLSTADLEPYGPHIDQG
jgi:glutathione S-transferase